MKLRKTEDKIVGPCILCGKRFIIKVRKLDKKIMSACFHSHMRKYLFMHWAYPVNEERWKLMDAPWYKKIFYIEKVHFSGFGKTKKIQKRNKIFWTIIGYTRLQRWIIYSIWKIFYGNQKIEYWECGNCCKSTKIPKPLKSWL